MEQAVVWAVMAPRMRKTSRQEANHIGTEVIIDLPIGFPINNIISRHAGTHNLWLVEDHTTGDKVRQARPQQAGLG